MLGIRVEDSPEPGRYTDYRVYHVPQLLSRSLRSYIWQNGVESLDHATKQGSSLARKLFNIRGIESVDLTPHSFILDKKTKIGYVPTWNEVEAEVIEIFKTVFDIQEVKLIHQEN